MKVNWGVLGTASIAKHCTIPGMIQAESCNLYAIAGRNAEKVQEFKDKFGFEKGYVGYENLVNDPMVQAVYIPLPNNIHKEWVIACLKAQKHVLCEKPMALNAEESREMYRVARENGVILMEAYAYLHSPYVQALKDEVKGGALGQLMYIDTAFVTQGYTEDFRLHKELGGGMVYDLGCYCTTMILSLVDSPIDYVKAVAEMTDEDVDAFTTVIIKFQNGVRASFVVGMALGENSNARYDKLYIHGSEGNIRSEVEYNEEGNLQYLYRSKGTETVKKIYAPQNYALEVENLSKSILGQEKPLVTEEFSVRNAELLDRILNEIDF